MINLYKILSLFTLICIGLNSSAQTKLTRAQIANTIRGKYWRIEHYRQIKEWGAIYSRSDSLNWKYGTAGLFFRINGTFTEYLKANCWTGRKPYTNGTWIVSNDTLFLIKTDGDTLRPLKIMDVNREHLVVRFAK